MLRISKLTDYAARLMQALARESSGAASATTLALVTRIEPATTSKLLKLLAKANLLSATRGVTGGYRLSRTSDTISMADIIIAIEGPIGMTDCSHGPHLCDQESFCGTSLNWKLISVAVETALRQVSLADLAPLKTIKKIPTPILLQTEREHL